MTPLERLEERLSAYLDGELTSAERSAVEAELEASAEARETLGDLRLVRSALVTFDDVRAPRSFALAAPPARMPAGGSLALMRRLELFVRAGAAGAALLFVVAVVHEPTSLATGGVAEDAVLAFEATAPGPEALRAADPAGLNVAPAFAPAEATVESVQPAVAPAPANGAPVPAPSSGGGTGEGGVMGAAGADGGLGDGTDGTMPADGQPKGDAVPAGADTFATAASPVDDGPGTIHVRETSHGVGGVAPALATLAVLLGLLSVLLSLRHREEHS
ncbi:MAG: hypothetical protein CVU47_07185 [Chloroflexi bacterium HGW-Chloroflexi-9]|nr:MAG: hypothetical protein CVU47_07185 [Chloroflexi bacterium HGW-Chloroflexi-9]